MRYTYVTRIKSVIVREDPLDGTQLLGGETVHEPDDRPEDTGLVSSNGTTIYRVPVAKAIGFDLSGKRRS